MCLLISYAHILFFMCKTSLFCVLLILGTCDEEEEEDHVVKSRSDSCHEVKGHMRS